MREVLKAKKISKLLQENGFAPTSDDETSEVSFKALAWAIIYNYFSALQKLPMYIDE